MQYLRIIPSLLLSKGKLVKGKNFINHKNVGSPVTTLLMHSIVKKLMKYL